MRNKDDVDKRRCVVCYASGSDRAHYITKATLSKEEKWSPKTWRYLCRIHHQEEHRIGVISFAYKYELIDGLIRAGFAQHKVEAYLSERDMQLVYNKDKESWSAEKRRKP